jgi:hypothetical protein
MTVLSSLQSSIREHPFAIAAVGVGVVWLLGPARTLRMAGRLGVLGGGTGLLGVALQQLASSPGARSARPRRLSRFRRRA